MLVVLDWMIENQNEYQLLNMTMKYSYVAGRLNHEHDYSEDVVLE